MSFVNGFPTTTFPQIELRDAEEIVDCSDCEEQKIQNHAVPADCDPTSPIIIDMGADGFSFAMPSEAVFFWMFRHAMQRQVLNWVNHGTDDAFLALDLNLNGMIDNGNELFGDGTDLLLHQRLAHNGFSAMAQYDSSDLGGNEDGFLSKEDAVWPALLLWVDRNANGRSEKAELSPAMQHLNHIDLIAQSSSYRDEHGNQWRYQSHAQDSSGKELSVLDIYFVRHSELENDATLFDQPNSP